MYMKDMLRDWTYVHLLNCVWYLDCLKENTFTSKFEIQDLEPWKRRHQEKKDWKGAKGVERDDFKSFD